MTAAREFLDLYTTLEELLRSKYTTSDKKYSSCIVRFASEDGARWREELDLCREMRNILSHHSTFDGEEIFEPSRKLIDFLRMIINEVDNPPIAGALGTPERRIFKCSEDSRVSQLIRQMNKYGYSHVPLVKDGVLTGVFSAGILLAAFGDDTDVTVTESTRVGEFSRYLSPAAHTNECYRFVSPQVSYYDLRDVFIPSGPRRPRVAVVFVTENGEQNGRLISMITPWDMLRAQPE